MESFQKALDWLESLQAESHITSGIIRPSLKTTQKLLEAFGNPDLSFSYRIIIGGTAGKGTLTRSLQDTFTKLGIKSAAITSPHLQTPLERLRLGQKLIDRENWAYSIFQVKEKSEELNLHPTYYEALTVGNILTAAYFEAEILIGEIGLGGEYDSINAVKGKRISVVTFIGEDHAEILGDFPAKARTKARIFNTDSILNLSYEKDYRKEMQEVAAGPIQFLDSPMVNEVLIKEIVHKITGKSDIKLVISALPARWEFMPSSSLCTIILDGAHSLPRFESIREKIKALPSPKVAVFAMRRNHDPKSFKIVSDLFDEVIFTTGQEDPDLFWSPEELQKIFPQGIIVKNAREALGRIGDSEDSTLTKKEPERVSDRLRKDLTLISLGSFYFCGEVRNWFYPTEKIEEQRTEWPR